LTYQTLGGRPVTATLDETGRNPGNWTAQITESDFNANVDPYEVYHIYIATTQMLQFSATPITGQFQVWINGLPWDNVPYSANNSWDPSQPMILHPGDEVDFFFSFGTGQAPIVTVWLRYDDGT
jgi:hypothetical protein